MKNEDLKRQLRIKQKPYLANPLWFTFYRTSVTLSGGASYLFTPGATAGVCWFPSVTCVFTCVDNHSLKTTNLFCCVANSFQFFFHSTKTRVGVVVLFEETHTFPGNMHLCLRYYMNAILMHVHFIKSFLSTPSPHFRYCHFYPITSNNHIFACSKFIPSGRTQMN